MVRWQDGIVSGKALTSRDDDTHLLRIVDSHGFDVTFVHATVAGLCPPPLLALFTTQLENGDATIHTTREDSSAVGTGDKIETVRVVADQAL